MAAIASALIGPVASLFGGLFQGQAAKQAAGAEETGANKAGSLIAQNQNQALGIEQNMFNTEQQNEQPFLSAGQNAAGSLSQLMQSGALTPGTFTAPTINAPNSAQAFAEQQATQALQNSAAARGGLLTGGTAQALQQTAAGYGSQFYQQDYNNAVTNYQLGLAAQNQQYNQLAGVAGMGLTSAGQIGQVGTALSGQQANTLASGAAGQAAQIDAASQAQAAGIMGNANALTSGIFGATADLSSSGSGGLSSILQSLGIGSGGGSSGYSGGGGSSAPGLWDFSQGAPPPGYARGGHTTGKKPIIVGELGPELFVPDKSGFVLPNHSLKALLARYAA